MTETTTEPRTAWSMIGYDGEDGWVRVKGGRALYEAVIYYDNTPGEQVKLSRLVPQADGTIRQVDRYVHPDTELEVVSC